MSSAATLAVWDASVKPITAKLVLLALADWADRENRAKASFPELAEKARVSRPNARRIVRNLERAGILSTTKANNDLTEFILHLHRLPPSSSTGGTSASPRRKS